MKFCEDCWLLHKSKGWYIGAGDEQGADERECEAHPRLDNMRLIRTLKTLKVWSLEIEGYSVALTPTCKMPVNLGAGHVHERTAKAKMFDYETPFVDFLVKHGYVARHAGTPKTLTVTAKGDELLRQSQLEQEAKGRVGRTADYKK